MHLGDRDSQCLRNKMKYKQSKTPHEKAFNCWLKWCREAEIAYNCVPLLYFCITKLSLTNNTRNKSVLVNTLKKRILPNLGNKELKIDKLGSMKKIKIVGLKKSK